MRVVVVYLWFLTCIPSTSTKDVLLKGVFWQVKPYIFQNEKGVIDGIIPMIFQRAQHFCLRGGTSKKAIEFVRQISNRKEFKFLMKNHEIFYNRSDNSNISKQQTFWAPVVGSLDPAWEYEHNVRSFRLLKVNHIAVVVPRHYINLPSKIMRGLLSCRPIFVIAFLLSLVFSFIMWLIERKENEGLNPTFIKGCGSSIWWSFVSMTTVGYGDIVPRSVAGRIVALLWLFMGVMMACIMTATMTNVVAGIGDFTVYGKDISVLENSYESKVAEIDYGANIIPSLSYHDVLEKLHSGQVFAAMINTDVVAWYQDQIQHAPGHAALHVIKELPANLYIKCLVSMNVSEEVKELFRCMHKQEDEIYSASLEHYQKFCRTETFHAGSIIEICMTDVFIQVLIVIVLVLYMGGVLYDAWNFYHNKEKEKCGDNTTKVPFVRKRTDMFF